jgi:hypothetical protein
MCTKPPAVFSAPSTASSVPKPAAVPSASTKAPSVFGSPAAATNTASKSSVQGSEQATADDKPRVVESNKVHVKTSTPGISQSAGPSSVAPLKQAMAKAKELPVEDALVMSASTPEEFKKIIYQFNDRVRAKNSGCHEDDDADDLDASIDQLVICSKQTRQDVGDLLNDHHEVIYV